MKIFLDTNVLIDILEHRSGDGSARKIVESYTGPFDRLCVSYLSLADITYILRKSYSENQMREILFTISSRMKVLSGLGQHYYDLQKVSGNDIEDCLQILCAEYEKCDVILTQNVRHFRGNTNIPVLTPDEFLSHCQQ